MLMKGMEIIEDLEGALDRREKRIEMLLSEKATMKSMLRIVEEGEEKEGEGEELKGWDKGSRRTQTAESSLRNVLRRSSA